MYTTGEIAANIALESPGLDTLDILVLWKGFPTYASTQTIFTILKAEWFHLQENQYVKVDPLSKWDVVVPGQHELGLTVPWGGTSHPVWFKNDPRVANVKVAGGVMNRPVMEAVVATTAAVESDIKTLPREQWDDALAKVADQWASGMPPRENPRLNISVDSVHASGPLGRKHVVIHGNSNYKQTGLMQAWARDVVAAAAAAADRVRVRLPGLRAPGAAGRAALVRARARPGGDRAPMSLVAYLDKGASLGPDAPCLTMGERSLSYAEVQDLSRRVAGALARSGVRPGDSVAILSGNDPTSFACVFGIARAGAVWCPVNPRNEAEENRELLELFDCRALLYQPAFAPLVAKIRDRLPLLTTFVCLGLDRGATRRCRSGWPA